MRFDKRRMRFGKRNHDYEAGYRDGSTNYELEHCPACKNVADLQEALDENAKLRKMVQGFLSEHADYLGDGNYFIGDLDLKNAMRHNQAYFKREARKLGIEVNE